MPSFNGETLIITLDLGVTEVDIQDDLYSDWKDWLISGTTGENRKYPQAFRVVGGDNLTPGIKAGAYFFLQNQSGWRIKPAEKDETVLLTGNLAPEDSSLPMLVPTDGEFSVLVAGLQPITQSVEEILVQGQVAEYNGIVAVDFINGTAGNAYPQGLKSNPVDNVLDAFLVATRILSKTFEISNGTFNLDRDALSYTFIDGGGQGGVNVTGYNVGGSKFLGTTLLNTSFSATTSGVRVIGSNIVSVSDFRGYAENCGIIGTISLQPQLTTFHTCFSVDTLGLNVIFDCQSGNTQLNMSTWAGTFTLKNTGTGFTGNVNVDSAEVILDQSCSDGNIEVRGVGFLDDLSTGILIDRKGFISGEDILQLREYIYIDTINGSSGTTENVGISSNPSNNLADAYILSLKRNIKKFKIFTEENANPIVLDRDYETYAFEGAVGKNTAVINLNGWSVEHSIFDNVNISGVGSGDIVGRNINVVAITGLTGVIKYSGIDTIAFNANNSSLLLVDCFSNVAGDSSPTFDMGVGLTGNSIQVRKYDGSFQIFNSGDFSNKASFDSHSIRLTLDSSNTAGDFILRGTGNLFDNSSGVTLNKLGFMDARFLENLYRLQGLDPTQPMTVTQTTRDAGDISITITGDGETTSTVTRNP
jgi:hypothetical protein